MKSLYLIFFFLTLSTLYLRGQSITVTNTCNNQTTVSNNGNNIPTIYVPEGNNITITMAIPQGSNKNICDRITNPSGQNINLSGNDETREFTINSIAVSNTGYYVTQSTCNNSIQVKFILIIVPKPVWHISLPAICYTDADNPTVDVVITNPSGINTEYNWRVEKQENGNYSTIGNYYGVINNATGTTRNISLTDFSSTISSITPTPTEVRFVIKYSTNYNGNACTWSDSAVFVKHNANPIIMVNPQGTPPGSISYTLGSAPLDIRSVDITTVDNLDRFVYFKEELEGAPNITFGNYFIYTTEVSNSIITYKATYQGCIYSREVPINVVGSNNAGSSISFQNEITPTASASREVCIGDLGSFSYATINNELPKYMTFRGANDTVFILGVQDLNGQAISNVDFQNTTITAPSSIPSDYIYLDNATAYYQLTGNTVKIYFKSMPSFKNGIVNIYKENDPFPSSPYKTTGILVVNAPIVDFYPKTVPLCSNSDMLFLAVPSDGTYSARVSSLNMTTLTPPYIDTNFIAYSNAFDNNRLRKSALGLANNENTGGKLVEVTYSYKPKYTMGTPCPEQGVIKVSKIFPVFNNENISISFPIIELDPNVSNPPPFILNNEVSIRPELITTPDANAVISGPQDLIFTGTWVEAQDPNTPNSLQVFNRANVNGDYTVEMKVNNNGCIMQASGQITVIDKATFDSLSSEVCRQAGIMKFYRPLGMNYSSFIDLRSSDYMTDSLNLNDIIINRLTVHEQFKLVEILVYDLSINGTPQLISNTSAANSIVTIYDANSSTERFEINLQDPLLQNTTSIKVVGVFESSRQSYEPVLGFERVTVLPTTIDTNQYRPIAYLFDYSQRINTEQTCTFRNQLTTTLNGIPSMYCEQGSGQVNITMSPSYGMTNARMSIREANTPVSSNNPILSGAVLSAQDFLDISSARNDYIIRYENNRIQGCPIIGEAIVTFIPKETITMTLVGTVDSICKNDVPKEILITPYGSVPDHVGIDNINGTYFFNPNKTSVVTGLTTISLRHTDIATGCVSDTTAQIEVLPLPNVNIQVENITIGQDRELNICPNSSNLKLKGYYNNDSVAYPNTASTFSGFSVVGDILKTDSLSPTQPDFFVYFEYTDTLGCSNKDSIKIKMRDFPILGLATTNNDSLPLSLCANAESILIVGFDLRNTTGAVSNSILKGRGIINSQNNLVDSIASNQARYSIVKALNSYADTTGIRTDTIKFIHSNQFGCIDTLEYVFAIDTVIKPIINNIASHYCIDAPPIMVDVTPLPSDVVTSRIRGYGVSNASHINHITLTPAIAFDSAGINNFVITYEAKGANDCWGIATDTTKIIPLPTALINLPTNICLSGVDEEILVTTNGNATYTISSDSSHFFRYDSNLEKYFMTPNQLPATNIAISYPLQIHLLDSIYGCTDIINRQVLVNPRPAIDIQNMDTEHLVCSNSGELDISGFPMGLSSTTAFFSSSLPSSHFLSSSGSTARILIDSSLAGLDFDVNYTYTDIYNCTEVKTKRIYITPAPSLAIANLDSAYCRIPTQIIPLTGISNVNSANISFSGQGVYADAAGNYSLQLGLTLAGNNTITAQAEVINTLQGQSISCIQTEDVTIRINPLPMPNFAGIYQNQPFCSTSDTVHLSADAGNGPSFVSFSFMGGLVARDSALVSNPNMPGNFYYDFYYYLDFSLANSNIVDHNIILTATTNEGCVNDIDINVKVHQAPITYFTAPGLDTNITASTSLIEICDSKNNISFVGEPATGIFSIVNQSPTSLGQLTYNSLYSPNINYIHDILPAVQYDTILYTVVTELVCTTYHAKVVKVNPIPRPTMVIWNNDTPAAPVQEACLGDGPFRVEVSPLGGNFIGGGIRDSLFSPHIVGLGRHEIRYEYTDALTQCSHYDSIVITVSSMPFVELTPDGACANNDVTINLADLNLNQVYDSISSAQWIILPNTYPTPVFDSTSIEPLLYRFMPGVHEVVLEVTNNNYCTSRDTLRLIVNEHITLSTDPYMLRDSVYKEDFEMSSGGWHHEMKNSYIESDIWKWGNTASNHIFTRGNGTKFWSTTQQSYANAHDGWVYSPCFDISTLERPMLSLDYFKHMDFGNDGVVLEYYDDNTQQWLPLGQENRGINWYNHSVIAGSPGNQIISPRGWTGVDSTWMTGRYILDHLRNNTALRFRVAFGAMGIFDVNQENYQGFAFDNFMIRNRQRNVLLEHFCDQNLDSMSYINNMVYHHVYAEQGFPYDLALMQVHTNTDPLFIFNSNYGEPHNGRRTKYSANAGDLVVNGITKHATDRFETTRSRNISSIYYEEQILETPYFFIIVDTVYFRQDSAVYKYRVKPNLEHRLDSRHGILIYSAIVTDSVLYPNNNMMVHSYLKYLSTDATYERAILPDSGIVIEKAISINNPYDMLAPIIDTRRSHFIFWVQRDGLITDEFLFTNEILQVKTSRHIIDYLHSNPVSITPAVKDFANQLVEAKLYPNPTYDMFNVDFSAPIIDDCAWKLYDMRGVLLQEGQLHKNTENMQVQLYDYPAGVYIYTVEHKDFRIHMRVIVQRP